MGILKGLRVSSDSYTVYHNNNIQIEKQCLRETARLQPHMARRAFVVGAGESNIAGAFSAASPPPIQHSAL